MTRDFPTIREVVDMHDDQLLQFGGEPGIRDTGALDSAIMRPQIGYYNVIIEEAAALLESLAMNHPFVDGNKRTAFAATEVFLRINGYFIDCDSLEAHEHFMHLFDTNSFRFTQLVDWLSDNVKSLPSTRATRMGIP
ncbi:MAG: type II toxin-antitoxin system death-on-curing family toxin [Chloroflexi bacterium]|nr:type II toxin-antitoxin system death-on-curing family toxin [Chloroflexota bacterium]